MALIGFPNPVDERAARLVAGGVTTMAVATVVLDEPLLMAPLAYGFAARVLTGPKLSPLGQLVTKVVVPRLGGEPTVVPGPPKRLAQGMGLAMSGAALLLHHGLGRTRLAYGLLTALGAAAALEAFAGFCIACRLFPLLMKGGLVSQQACEQCTDIWSRTATAA